MYLSLGIPINAMYARTLPKQTAASSGSAKVLRMLNHSGALQFAVRNDGSLVSQGRGVATAVSTVKGVLPIYDNTDTLVGYVPIYTGYTP